MAHVTSIGLTRLPIFSSNAPILDAVQCSTAYSVSRVFLNLGKRVSPIQFRGLFKKKGPLSSSGPLSIEVFFMTHP